MNRRRLITRIPLLAVLCAILTAALPIRAVGAQPVTRVVARGLDNPRGLAFDSQGRLLVAEAGRGGSGPCVKDPEGGKTCWGPTSAITRLDYGEQTRIVKAISSMAGKDGSNAGGVHAVTVDSAGRVYAILGLGANPKDRDQLAKKTPGLALFGHVVQVLPNGSLKDIADVSRYEQVTNPDKGEIDTNPYAVLADKRGLIVADAGGNDLLLVKRNGKVSTLAVFPSRMVDAPPALKKPKGTKIPMQSVPTAVARGPDGAYYVGELTGFPFPKGGAQIYRVVPGHKPTVYARGFTNIIGLTFGKDGNLYVLQITKDGLLAADQGGKLPVGALIRVKPDGSRSVLMTKGLVAPAGLTQGLDGALYVSNYGIFAGKGHIMRIAL